MASRITDMDYGTNYKDGTVFCDTIDSLASVDTSVLEQGAMALIQSGTEKGNVYTLLSTKVWELLNG